jgi:hypothetical protein
LLLSELTNNISQVEGKSKLPRGYDFPLTGAIKDPIAIIPVALPILSGCMRSPIDPPSKAAGVIPTQPDKNRKAMNMPILMLVADAEVKARNKTLETWYTITLPYISDSGAVMSGPKAKPTTYIESDSEVKAEL